MGNSTPCKIVTPENFILKLCTRNDVGEITRHANFGFNRYSGASPQIGEILPPCAFFWLSCTSYLFSRSYAGPIYTLYGSNDVFPVEYRKHVGKILVSIGFGG